MPRSSGLSLSEKLLLDEACSAFARSTRRFKARPARGRGEHDLLTDSAVQFDVAGKKFDMPVLLKTRADLSNVMLAQHRLHASAPAVSRRPLMLVTQYVSPQLAAHLIERNIPFLDVAGNVYFSEPEGTVMITGRPRPRLTLDTLSSARATTRKGLQVMFAIATHPGLVSQPYRTIAEASGVALSTVNHVIDDLTARGFVALKRDGQRIVPDWKKFVHEWANLYPSRLRAKLGVRRFASMTPDWWRAFDFAEFGARLGGEAAADVLTHYLKAGGVTVYSHTAISSRFLLEARLRPDERGDVEILEAFWPTKRVDAWQVSHPELVHPLLIYADLVASGDSRNLSVADEIYDTYLTPLQS